VTLADTTHWRKSMRANGVTHARQALRAAGAGAYAARQHFRSRGAELALALSVLAFCAPWRSAILTWKGAYGFDGQSLLDALALLMAFYLPIRMAIWVAASPVPAGLWTQREFPLCELMDVSDS
jgi:hypothetical protein